MKRAILSLIGIALCSLGVVITYAYLHTGEIAFFQPADSSTGYPLSQALIAIVAMIFGIVFGGLHKRLAVRDDKPVNIIAELSSLFQSPEFFRSILVSPIVYCAVYVAIKEQPDRVIALLFAFQNGFFWDQIFARARPALQSAGDETKAGDSAGGEG